MSSLQVLAAVADLRHRLTPEQLFEVRSILDRNLWHYTLIQEGCGGWATGMLSAPNEQAAIEELAFKQIVVIILDAAVKTLNEFPTKISPLAAEILQYYIDAFERKPDITTGTEVRDLFQHDPGYVAAISELIAIARKRRRLFVIVQSLGDMVPDD